MNIIAKMSIIYIIVIQIFLINILNAQKNYCDITCENTKEPHIVCKSNNRCKIPASECLEYKNGSLTDSDRDLILGTHNELRNKIASGDTILNVTISNMNMLFWNDELEYIALCWVNHCGAFTQGCFDTDRGKTGINEAYKTISIGENNFDKPGVLKLHINNWFGEIALFTVDVAKSFPAEADIKQNIHHFTQLVWAKTEAVGCARSIFGMYSVLFVCLYWPAGNTEKEEVFRLGDPCDECRNDCNDYCDVEYNSLCSSIEKRNILDENIFKANEKHTNNKTIQSRNEATLSVAKKKVIPLNKNVHLNIVQYDLNEEDYFDKTSENLIENRVYKSDIFLGKHATANCGFTDNNTEMFYVIYIFLVVQFNKIVNIW